VNAPATAAAPPTLAAVFRRFLGFGLQAFGGPVVQIATLQHELVQRERWVTDDRFRRALALYQALPGPEATELCIWFGTAARGRLGGLLAGLGFVLPGLLLMLLACWLLFGLAVWPAWLAAAIAGMQAAVTGLVLMASVRLARRTIGRRRELAMVALAAGLGASAGVPFVVALLGGGAVVMALHLPRRLPGFGAHDRGNVPLLLLAASAWLAAALLLLPAGTAIAAIDTPAAPTVPAELGTLLGSGLRAGLLTFGGAYTAIPFLHGDAVVHGGWLTESQFLAGLAIGGVLPAPMVILGTWVGWAGGGLAGALLLTLGIFLPAFVFPLLLHDRLERLIAHAGLHAFLDGIAAAVVGLVAWTAIALTRPLWSDQGLGLAIATGSLGMHMACRHRLVTPLTLLVAASAAMVAAAV
jgi:chromate transporter